MRKPRDFATELKALRDKQRQLRSRQVQQLGQLVIATGAHSLPVEQLAGLLLAAREPREPADVEVWRQRGAAFFLRSRKRTEGGHRDRPESGLSIGGGAASGSDAIGSAGQKELGLEAP